MIVTLTVVRYPKILIPIALIAMAIHRIPLALNPACKFWKLMGSGKNGTFDLNPDWQQWALLSTWATPADFESFKNNSFIQKWWKLFAKEQWTIVMKTLSSHGYWNNKQPFITDSNSPYSGPVCVLTRATIRLNKLEDFWKNVPGVAHIMSKSPGYITSFGIGEAPFFRQATLSIWDSTENMKAFAYGSVEHSEVIKKTRSRNWYSEELFARFSIVSTQGTIHGKNPLYIHSELNNESYS